MNNMINGMNNMINGNRENGLRSRPSQKSIKRVAANVPVEMRALRVEPLSSSSATRLGRGLAGFSGAPAFVATPDLMQIFRQNVASPNNLGASAKLHELLLDTLKSPSQWMHFRAEYDRLNDPDLQYFISSTFDFESAQMNELHTKAAETKADCAAISSISATASASCFSALAAVPTLGAIAFTGGVVIAGVAIGSLIARNYYARDEAAIQRKIDLLELVKRRSELTKTLEKGRINE
jgi:hypothetical protein